MCPFTIIFINIIWLIILIVSSDLTIGTAFLINLHILCPALCYSVAFLSIQTVTVTHELCENNGCFEKRTAAKLGQNKRNL